MLTDCAVAFSTSPICSATCMNRLLKISMRAGSAVAAAGTALPPPSSSSSSPPGNRCARQPPPAPRCCAARPGAPGRRAAPRAPPPPPAAPRASCRTTARARCGSAASGADAGTASVVASTEAWRASTRSASITTCSASAAKPKRRRCSRMEALAHGIERGGRHRQGDVAVAGPQLQEVRDAHRGGGFAVGAQLGARLRLECRGSRCAPPPGPPHRARGAGWRGAPPGGRPRRCRTPTARSPTDAPGCGARPRRAPRGRHAGRPRRRSRTA